MNWALGQSGEMKMNYEAKIRFSVPHHPLSPPTRLFSPSAPYTRWDPRLRVCAFWFFFSPCARLAVCRLLC